MDGVKGVVAFESVQASNFRDEVHHPVVAAHELAETGGGGAEVLLAVGVCELGGAAEHGGAEDVDPGRQRHIEWRVHVGVVDDRVWKFEFADEAGGGLEVLVPGNIGETVVRSADYALEEYHAKRCFEDLEVVGIAVEGFAKFGYGRIAMAHDVAVGLIAVSGTR